MSNVIAFPGMTDAQKAELPLDALRDDYGDPESTRVRRENLAAMGVSDRNPPPTLNPEALGRVKRDLEAGRFKRTPHNLHQVEDAMHESGFPGPGGSAA